MVYPSELFEKDFDIDQYILRMQFHDNSYDLGSNNLLKYEENATYIHSNVWCIDVANEEKLDFPYSSYMEAQGESQFDPCNSLNEVEYYVFGFLVKGIHGSANNGQF